MRVDIVRTKETIARYKERKENNKTMGSFVFDLESEEILQEFRNWVIIKNEFPYDGVTDIHHMLVPKRFFGTPIEMSAEEREELENIKVALGGHYDGLFENLHHKRSVPAHFHIHLFKWKEYEI